MAKNNKKGTISEFFARLVLRIKGYKILEKNFVTGKKTGAGEIDIIAIKRKTIVFIEVKQRKTIEDCLYSIRKNQLKRIYRGAESFIKQNPKYQNYDMRFDAILFNEKSFFTHLKNIS